MCSHCEKKRAEDLHPYTHKILSNISLQDAGYPIEANDLTLEEWHDLAALKKALQPKDNTSDILKLLIRK